MTRDLQGGALPILSEVDKEVTKERLNHHGLLWVWVLIVLSYGCTKQIRPSLTIVKQDTSLEALLDRYQNRLEPESGIKALMEVKTQRPNRGGHSFLASWHSRDESIRIRGFNLFGGTLFDLQLSDPDFLLNIPSENMRFQAPLDELEDIAGEKIPFGSLELLEWVKRAGVPMVNETDVPALEKGDDLFILYLFTLDGDRARLREKVWIERTRFWVKKVELFDRTGLRRGVILLDDYRGVDSRHFPFSVSGKMGGGTVSLNFREVSRIAPPQKGQGIKDE